MQRTAPANINQELPLQCTTSDKNWVKFSRSVCQGKSGIYSPAFYFHGDFNQIEEASAPVSILAGTLRILKLGKVTFSARPIISSDVIAIFYHVLTIYAIP